MKMSPSPIFECDLLHVPIESIQEKGLDRAIADARKEGCLAHTFLNLHGDTIGRAN